MEYSKDIDYKNCRFISDGTWLDKGSEAKLQSLLPITEGMFEGMFIGKFNGELVDGELCPFEEFYIYDEQGKLLHKPRNY